MVEKRIDIKKQIELFKTNGITIEISKKVKILKYLESGYMFALAPGRAKDEFDESKGYVPMTPTMLTDGEWIWSGLLSYYIRVYNISLPDEFIQHIELCDYSIDREAAKIKFWGDEYSRTIPD